MVSIRSIATSLAILASVVSAAPAAKISEKFHIRVLDPDSKLNLTNSYLEAYHTGAGTADPVFQKANKGPLAYLNGTHLQLDVGQGNAYPFSLVASTTDLNYARWELTSISIGWGSGKFVNNGPEGLQLKDEEFGGWVLCEWFHVLSDEVQNAPQLFVANSGFDGNKMAGGPKDLPASCANVLLFPEFV